MSGKAGIATSLTAGALALVLGSSLVDQRRGASEMSIALESQSKALESSAKIESQLDALAKGISGLALSGNANAQRIVATLKQNGVSIK